MTTVRTIGQLFAWLEQEQPGVCRDVSEAGALLVALGMEPDDLGRAFGALLLESNWATADRDDLAGCIEWMEGMVATDPSAYSGLRSGFLILDAVAGTPGELDGLDREDDTEAEEPYCPLCGESAVSLADLHGHLQNAHRLDPVEAARVVGEHWVEESDQRRPSPNSNDLISDQPLTDSLEESGQYGSNKFSF